MGLRNKASALALGVFLSTSFVNAAKANTFQQKIEQNDSGANVPIKNMQGQDTSFVKSIAAQVSKNAIVLSYFGNNPVEFKIIQNAANQLKSEGIPVRGIVVGDGDGDWGIFVNGLEIANDNGDIDKDGKLTVDDLLITKEVIVRFTRKNWQDAINLANDLANKLKLEK